MVKSKIELFREKIAELVKTSVSNVDVFSVQLKQLSPPVADIRFSAHGSPYYEAIMLNGLVLQNREQVKLTYYCHFTFFYGAKTYLTLFKI